MSIIGLALSLTTPVLFMLVALERVVGAEKSLVKILPRRRS
jgi:hypothetical protein